MVDFIQENRQQYGVESICDVLPIAPSRFYEQTARREDESRIPARWRRDARLIINCCRKAAFSKAISLWPARTRIMNGNVLTIALT